MSIRKVLPKPNTAQTIDRNRNPTECSEIGSANHEFSFGVLDKVLQDQHRANKAKFRGEAKAEAKPKKKTVKKPSQTMTHPTKAEVNGGEPNKAAADDRGFDLAISEYVSVNRESGSLSSMSTKTVKYLHKRRLEERGYRMTNRKLGEGGFGAVYKVYPVVVDGGGHRTTDRTTALACKIMVLSKDDSTRFHRNRNSMLTAFSNEVFVLQSCGPHRNLIRVRASFLYSHGPSTEDVRTVHSYIVMEYASGGTLYSKLKKQSRPFPERQARGYFRQLAAGVEHLHRRGIAHRDLKLGNILLTKGKSGDSDSSEDGEPAVEVVKLTDFGLSRLVHSRSSGLVRLSKPAGTLSYMSPELVRCYVRYHSGQRASIRPYQCFPTDQWALGVCLYLLLCKVHPFDSPPRDKSERLEYARAMLARQCTRQWSVPESVRPHLSGAAIELVRALMDPSRRTRLDIYQVTAHMWLTGTKWISLRSAPVADTRAEGGQGDQFGASGIQ